jgi:outer membrane protein assembly factor BamE (lipoprotein component of BamABCDE complex)
VKALLVAFVVLVIGACASTGKQFDRTHVNDIKNTVQTKSDIRGWFGEPYQVVMTNLPPGTAERWTYVYAHSSYGGAKTESASLVVDFDKDGKVCDHAYQEMGK